MSALSTLSVPSNSLNTVHVAIPIYGKAVTDAGTVRCHAGMLTLPRRHGNVVTPAWQRCYAGMASDYKAGRNGNVPFRDGYMPMENGLRQRYLSV